jgi:hypothetical protein
MVDTGCVGCRKEVQWVGYVGNNDVDGAKRG